MERFTYSRLPLFTQLATTLIASLLIVAIVVLTTETTNQRANRAAAQSDAAVMVGRMDAEIHVVRDFLEHVPPGQGIDVLTALDIHDAMLAIGEGSAAVVALVDSPETQQLPILAQDTQLALRSFFETQSPDDVAGALASLEALDEAMELRVTEFDAQADTDQQALKSTANRSQLLIITTCIAAALITAVTSLVIGRGQRRALVETRSERDDLAELTNAVQKRNEQFAALYQIVSEITDNLSMRYIVNTAVSEAGKLVKADHVELRLLENGGLAPRGLLREGEVIEAVGEPLPLGVGLAGKAAKRGRTLRFDSGVEATMADEERVLNTQSGLIVPLIVGARVVGTIACWSKEVGRFDADDERVLELMASQVATAVAAADLHASSEQQASHDALTGLPNRRRLVEDSGDFQEALDSEARMAVVMFDIDHFKRFNDDFGHKVGDVTLQKVASVMQGAMRASDHLYRYGGEEFLLVLPDVDEEKALQLVERIRQAVERTILTGQNLEPVGPVTISGGVAISPENGDDLSTLIAMADQALYKSKEAGRNRITLFEAASRLSEVA